jgi:hypothetical protein
MDINQLKKILDKEKSKIVIVENGEPIMVVSSFEDYQQRLSFNPAPEAARPGTASFYGDKIDRKSNLTDNRPGKRQEIIQNTELISKEELPSDELTIEDLPF